MSPFDAARYARLLEGLEISILNYSQVVNDENPTKRFDSSYFQKEFLGLARHPHAIGEFAVIRSGTTPSDRDDDLSEGVILLKTVDIQNRPLTSVDASLYYKISPEIAARMEKTRLCAGDVLINIVGATTDVIGRVALVPANFPEANITQAMALIRTQDSQWNSGVLFCFLAGKYGQAQVRRLARPTGQYNMNLPEVESIRIPSLGVLFGKRIKEIVENSQDQRDSSRRALSDAELRLKKALELQNWKAPEPLSYAHKSSEAFAAERLDAEYFHPAKSAALLSLRSTSDLTVGDLFSSVRHLWQPDSGLPTDLVRNYDLNDALAPFLDGSKPPVVRAEIASTKKSIQAGDLVVSRLRSYLREIAIVESSQDYPMVASTEYIVLRPREECTLPVEALLVYLRSQLPQLVFHWSQDGSNHPRFDEKELLRMPVPRALMNDPAPYVLAMQNLKAARQQATQFLDAAKRAVEIAIEDSEAAALAYLAEVVPPAN